MIETKYWIKLASILILLSLIGIIWFKYRQYFDVSHINELITSYGLWAPVIFIALYMAACVLFFPASLLTVVGGLLFGLGWGTAYNILGATIGATGAFLLGRYFAADWVLERLSGKAKILQREAKQSGWRMVAVLRLAPIFPFNFLNYALGVTGISCWTFVWASFVFMLPGCLAYTYLGVLGGTLALKQPVAWINMGLIALGVLALIIGTKWLVKKLRGHNEL